MAFLFFRNYLWLRSRCLGVVIMPLIRIGSWRERRRELIKRSGKRASSEVQPPCHIERYKPKGKQKKTLWKGAMPKGVFTRGKEFPKSEHNPWVRKDIGQTKLPITIMSKKKF